MNGSIIAVIVLGLVCSVLSGTHAGETTMLATAAKTTGGSVDYGGYRPHYQGFGINTKGGRGGVVLRVTNLNDSGPGSLREALTDPRPRIVIFETSGTIPLQSALVVTAPYLTIAGQTAPSPGINIRNYGIYIDTHDVVVQHIRVRVGDTHGGVGLDVPFSVGTDRSPWDEKAGRFTSVRPPAYNVVFDHVSAAWTLYMGFFIFDVEGLGSNWPPPSNYPTDVALLDSIIAFGLVQDPTNCGMGGSAGKTSARNLYVHNSHRTPVTGKSRAPHDPKINIVNNVLYGSGPYSPKPADGREDFTFLYYYVNGYGSEQTNPAFKSDIAIVNNVIIPSLGTGSGDTAGSTPETHPFFFNIAEDNLNHQEHKVWLSGNIGPHITGPTGNGQKDGIAWASKENFGAGNFANDPRLWHTKEPAWLTKMKFKTIPSEQVCDYVFANAGARPLDRDPVDIAAVSHARSGEKGDTKNMGARIRSQEDMGGHPVLAVNVRRLTVPENLHAIASGQKFRTNIEMWLEKMARDLEPTRK